MPSRPHLHQRVKNIRPRACDELERTPKKQIRQLEFDGERICLSFSRAPQFWAHRWAVLSSCRPIYKKLWRIMTLSSLGFRCWTTRSLLGHCCCIALGAEPITCGESSDLNWFKISRRAITLVSGGVWHGFSQFQRELIPLRRPLRHHFCLWRFGSSGCFPHQ